MALRIKDRVKQGTNTTGSGTINLDVSFSSSGFQDFSVLGNGTETYYAIEEGSNFEIGLIDFKDSDYFQTLRTKMGWGTRGNGES